MDDLNIGANDSRLVVRNTALGAKLLHDRIGPGEPVARHGGKQVVLHLVIQSAVEEIDKWIGTDVARCEHLLPQKIDLGALGIHRHALVVGREHHTHVETKCEPVHDHEHHCDPEWQRCQEESTIGEKMADEDDDIKPDVPEPILAKEGDVAVDEGKVGERLDGEKEPALMLHRPAFQSAPLARLLFGIRDKQDVDIGVHVLVVGVRMMPVVLVHPPLRTAPKEEAADVRNNVIERARLENLAVTGIVEEEPDLDVHKRQEHRVEYLDPDVIGCEHHDEADREQRSGQYPFQHVVEVLPLQQASPHDLVAQDCKISPGAGGSENGIRHGEGILCRIVTSLQHGTHCMTSTVGSIQTPNIDISF